jgi:hypothetical protein
MTYFCIESVLTIMKFSLPRTETASQRPIDVTVNYISSCIGVVMFYFFHITFSTVI